MSHLSNQSPIQPSTTAAVGTTGITKADTEHEAMKAGFVGKIFGSNNHVPSYIAGTVAILALITALVISIFVSESQLGFPKIELWKFTIPLVTTPLAFIFGKAS